MGWISKSDVWIGHVLNNRIHTRKQSRKERMRCSYWWSLESIYKGDDQNQLQKIKRGKIKSRPSQRRYLNLIFI